MTEETIVLPSGGIGVVVDPKPTMTHAQEIKALKKFAADMEKMSPNARRAAIFWLADFYLGIKLWGQW